MVSLGVNSYFSLHNNFYITKFEYKYCHWPYLFKKKKEENKIQFISYHQKGKQFSSIVYTFEATKIYYLKLIS